MLENDYFKADNYYQKSADLGNRRGFFNLGFYYEKGVRVKKDYQRQMNTTKKQLI